ncbi:MAG: glycosyltransferase [Bacteroidia bacterium]|jgi:sugar transferase (PEP-CTERM/EpsH1 system associated)|nr:glycosyltransferase [Bacteroidia bacterium]
MKLFVITSRIPWPLEKGDKLRMYHQLRLLAEEHEIILCALNDGKLHPDADAELRKFCTHIHYIHFSKPTLALNLLRTLFGRLPFQTGYFWHRKAQKLIDSFVAYYKPDLIYCQLIRTSEYARKHKRIPKVLDYMDVFSKGTERRIEKVAAWKRPVFRMEWKRLLNYEREVFEAFDAHIIISDQDRMLMPVSDPKRINVIGNGVDMNFFQPLELPKTHDILFNGNMSYPPNVESAEYLVQKVLPLVHKRMPGVKVLITGATPSAAVLALKSGHVTVTGWVDDVRTGFAQSRMLVAPMQSSIGLQNKLLEAMAMRIPCLTTTLSNNALKAQPGTEIIVADSPQAFADAIVELLGNEEISQQLAQAGYEFVKANFSWESSVKMLSEVFEKTKAAKE